MSNAILVNGIGYQDVICDVHGSLRYPDTAPLLEIRAALQAHASCTPPPRRYPPKSRRTR